MNRIYTEYTAIDASGFASLSIVSGTVKAVSVGAAIVVVRIIELVLCVITGYSSLTSAC